MSWINDIAGRAEDLLNKIDNGAATVLNQDKKKKSIKSPKRNIVEEICITENYSPTLIKKSPLHVNLAIEERKPNKIAKEDEKLFQYLNNSTIDIDSLEPINRAEAVQSKTSSDLNIIIEDSKHETNLIISLQNENEMLKNEVRSLNSEVSLLMGRTKSSEREMALAKSLLMKKEGELIVLEKEITSLKQRLVNIESENNELYSENMTLEKTCKTADVDKNTLENTEAKLSQYQLDAQQKEEALKADIASLRISISEVEQSFLKEKGDSAKELSEVNSRLREARKELGDYRAKAQWSLSEKEKLISELRNQRENPDSEFVVTLELQQLRDEKINLIQDLEDIRNKLERSRQQELETEKRLECVREEASGALKLTQTRLSEETARRLAAEEHSTSHAEELHSVREELWRQVGSLNSRLKERERELTRLRRQLSERVVTRPEPELTAALVQKQESIELLSIENNQLRLQIERMKISYGQDLAKHRQTINVNDTDDAKAQLPSFMMRSPFDGGVKRAYSCVEAISRCIFLRRHPFARVILFCYLIVLHLWLCIVLFSYTPDSKMQV